MRDNEKKPNSKVKGRPVKNVIKRINASAKMIAKSMYVGANTQKIRK